MQQHSELAESLERQLQALAICRLSFRSEFKYCWAPLRFSSFRGRSNILLLILESMWTTYCYSRNYWPCVKIETNIKVTNSFESFSSFTFVLLQMTPYICESVFLLFLMSGSCNLTQQCLLLIKFYFFEFVSTHFLNSVEFQIQ